MATQKSTKDNDQDKYQYDLLLGTALVEGETSSIFKLMVKETGTTVHIFMRQKLHCSFFGDSMWHASSKLSSMY